MADMKIAMTLTMADLASPEIQKFKANVARLETYLKGLGDSFKVAIGGAADLGKATGDAAGGITALSRASSGATRTTGRLGESLRLMQDALNGMAAKISEIADSTAALATSTADLSGASKSAAAGIAAMGDAAGAADAKMAGMHGTMKGLVELYGAFKIGEGMKSSVNNAAAYQNYRLQLQNLNLPKTETSNILQNARQWQKIPGVSKLNAMEAAMAGVTGAPGAQPYQQGLREAIMPMALRAAVVLKSTYGDKNSIHDILKNFMGLVEVRGKMQSVAAAKKAIQTAFHIAVGSDYKVGLGAQETGARNTGYGEAAKQSTWSTFLTGSATEQFKSSGGGGGGGGSGGNTKAATIVTMTAASALGGKMQKAQAIMLEQAGLLTRNNVRKIRGSSQVFVTPQSILGSSEAQTNPWTWIRNILVPHFATLTHKMHPKLKGKAFQNMLNDELAVYAKTAGGVNVGTGYNNVADTSLWHSLVQRAHIMQNTATIGQASHNASKKLTLQMRDLRAAMETVSVQIGTALLPAMQLLAGWATDAGKAIQSLNTHMPVFKSIEAWVGAIGAVMLGIKGVEWLMGIRQGFIALKALNFAGTLTKWAATAILGEDAVAGLATGLGGLGATIAGLAAPISLAVVAIGAFGYAAYSMRHQLESGWAEFKHYLHPHAYPLPSSSSTLGLGLVTTKGGWGGPVTNTSLAASKARESARATAVNPASVGYLGPVTAQGAAMAAQKAAKAHGVAAHHATMLANAHQKAIDHLFAIADKAAVKADAVAAKMNAAAVKLHLAFMAMTHPLGAKIMGVNLKYGAISSQMAKSGHPGAALDALSIGQSKIMGIKYQSGMQHLAMLKANLHNTITGNAALVETGSMTKMQAGQANIAAQKQAAPAMVNILKTLIAMEKASAGYAHNLASQKIVANLTAQETKLKAMGGQLGYYSAKVKNITQNAMSGLFQNMMHGQKTWGQMFGSFFASIGKSLENILANSISQAIANALFTKNAGKGIGSIFSFLTGGAGSTAPKGGSLLGAIGSLFSSSNGAASSNPFSGAGIMGAGAFQKGGSGSSTMSSIGGWVTAITSIAKIFGFATGANSIPNDMVANIHKGEMIIPAAGASLIRSGQASIGGMPAGNHLHLTIHAMDSQSVIGALHGVRHEAAQMFLNTASSMNLNGG